MYHIPPRRGFIPGLWSEINLKQNSDRQLGLEFTAAGVIGSA